ncbi:hypothetical protein IEQ34_010742 [Dendrobium chrysotoxum]|uniref:Uncharacterized protein n=1 Tax=Dendrobium chrysotoxum TaxID=161865 RepID=A0AAV7GE69_DENCH|nr:hypothetical protein IEQ34_010742 [Dendrobium chrysotoxum]
MGRNENHRCRQCNDSLGNDRNDVIDGEDTISLSDIAKIPVILYEEEELIGIEEEMVTEVMRWLEREISSPPPVQPVISGNQESCGPSISDSSSTVMANVDTSGGGGGGCLSFFFGAPAGPEFPASGIRSWIEGLARSQAADGRGGVDDEEWLVRAMSVAGVELEESLF